MQHTILKTVTALTKSQFDKPLSFTKLFDRETQAALMTTINKVKEYAVVIAA